MRISEKFMERLWKYISPEPMSGCWLWTGAVSGRPTHLYGVIKQEKKRKMLFAHRIFCEIEHGPIPAKMVCDHKCRNTLCVNPKHLRIVTQRINSIENSTGPTAKNAAKTYCHRGHSFSKENTIIFKSSKGKNLRQCAICYKINNDKSTERKRIISGSQFGRKALAKTKGAYFNKRDKIWFSSIQIDKKVHRLGTFKTKEEARNAYLKAAEAHVLGGTK